MYKIVKTFRVVIYLFDFELTKDIIFKKYSLTRLFLSLAHITFLSYNLQSQYYWDKVNLPDSLELYTMCFDESDIYIGTSNGVFFSEDNLQTIIHIGLNDYVISKILKTNDDKITVFTRNQLICKYLGNNNWNIYQGFLYWPISAYISTTGDVFYGTWGRAYKSIDHGITWDTVWTSSINEVMNSITENNIGNLFAGTRSYTSSSPGGVYRSDNDGESWDLVGLESYAVTSLASNSYNYLYASVYNASYGGVYKSLDSNGETWEYIYDENRLVNDLKVNQYNTLFIGCATQGFPGGIHYKNENGTTWIDITGDLPYRHIDNIFISPNNFIYILNQQANLLCKLSNPITHYDESYERNKFLIFPNPSVNNFNISILESGSFDLVIEDLNGVEVFYRKIKTENSQNILISTINLIPGIYFVKVSNHEHSYITKIVKL